MRDILFKQFQKAPENRTSCSFTITTDIETQNLACPHRSLPPPHQIVSVLLLLVLSESFHPPLLTASPRFDVACNRSDRPSTDYPAFNQVQVAYNASKDERVEKLREVMDAREAKYKVSN